MEIDYKGIENAKQKAIIKKQKDIINYKIIKEEEEKILEKNIKLECAELKNIYINIINNDVIRKLEQGSKYITIEKPIQIPNLINKYYFKQGKYDYNAEYYDNYLSYVCDDFDSKLLIKSFEEKTDMKIHKGPLIIKNGKYLFLDIIKNND